MDKGVKYQFQRKRTRRGRRSYSRIWHQETIYISRNYKFLIYDKLNPIKWISISIS